MAKNTSKSMKNNKILTGPKCAKISTNNTAQA